jgi:mono/diheme cytochrome c family protein
MPGRHFWCALGCALSLLACQHLRAQDEDEEEPYLPGLIATYVQGESRIDRLEPVVALHGSHVPDERLEPRPYSVTWRGLLLVPDDGPHQLHLHGAGSVIIKLNGQPVLRQEQLRGWASSPAQQLTFGPVPLEISYEPTGDRAQLALFWSSDRFEREPVPARALAHDRSRTISTEFDRGRVLARALRCEACHHRGEATVAEPIPPPALDRLAGNLHREWLIAWLRDDGNSHAPGNVDQPQRRMPFFNIPEEEATLLADWLLSGEPVRPAPEPQPAVPTKQPKAKPRTNEDLHRDGEHLFRARGCLACHALGENREAGLFGGGDLNQIATKRPREFFIAWLQKPELLNRDHRMPVFDLNAEERQALAFFLSAQGQPPAGTKLSLVGAAKKDHARARELAKQYRCDQCHRLPDAAAVAKLPSPRALPPLTAQSEWRQTCVAESFQKPRQHPLLRFANRDAQALQTYFSQRSSHARGEAAKPDGAQLLLENNCLACHAREPQLAGIWPQKLADKLVRLAEDVPALASQIPTMTPPSLNSVGDKLLDGALTRAITRTASPHRSYLQVQMPRFRLSPEQAKTLTQHFIDVDRIPDYEREALPEPTPAQQAARTLAGPRLVGTDGFSCTACHQVGSVQPVKAPPNARGPSLSMLEQRIRKNWFDRWVRNPARIVPRMEMPSVQIPVRGVLQDNLPEQLAAVWQTLNKPGFEPPLPEPVRTLRFYSSDDNRNQPPLVITDLIEHGGQTLERAALIGLPNRHNLLFDFATNRLLGWSQGDLARQRTRGKNWYWEPTGSLLLDPHVETSELALQVDGQRYEAATAGQWLAEPARWSLQKQTLVLQYRLAFRQAGGEANGKTHVVDVQQIIEPWIDGELHGVRRRMIIRQLPAAAKIIWRVYEAGKFSNITRVREERSQYDQLGEHAAVAWNFPAGTTTSSDGTLVFTPNGSQREVELEVRYFTSLPPDEYHTPRAPVIPFDQPPVVIAPGFNGERMALPPDVMPTALAWKPNGELVVASLKGQVLSVAADSAAPPRSELLADGLAAPYGLQAGDGYVDVLAKYGLLRITHDPEGGSALQVIASGWGYTSDYHDWAVGLPRDAAGNYYISLPCYQDNRPDAAKRLRGSLLKLIPRRATEDNPQLFDFEVLTHGHRFPMGMALNARDELFVTDNQGNYNPFNELNFVQKGRHFGFVNKGETAPPDHTSPSIAIPHPWTRSVNGICFLKSPPGTRGNLFGPLEGHLVGCEYDTRRLIRMSLQRVGDDYQGCCYPLTVPTPPSESPLGPICCEVSPTGELFIGSIRDSGWGAGNNIGEVIRVKVDPARFGHGLAEMRATATGFELDFFAPVEKELAGQLDSYSLSSYRRVSTPAYGGNDIDRRTEKITSVSLSSDRRRVTLTLETLRPGHVYELRLKSLAPAGELFFPAEAHYTLRQIPDR